MANETSEFLEALYKQHAKEGETPEETAQRISKNLRGVSRRELLGGAGAVGLGGLLGAGSMSATGTASAEASTSDSDGNVGTPSDPVDGFVDGLNIYDGANNQIGSLDENGLDIPAVITEVQSNRRYADNYGSIQAAIDDLPGNSADTTDIGAVTVPAKDGHYNETVTVNITGSTIQGQGINTRVYDSGSDVVNITRSDNLVEGFWIDELGSGSNDAVVVTAGENRLRHLDLDSASQYCLNIGDVGRCFVKGTQIKGGQVAGAIIDGGQHHVELEFQDTPSTGLIVAEFCSYSKFDITSFGTGSTTITLRGVRNNVDANIQGSGADGIFCPGDDNNITLNESGAQGDAIAISGNNNVVKVNSNNPVALQTGASDNVIYGRASTLNDNSGNSTNDTSGLKT